MPLFIVQAPVTLQLGHPFDFIVRIRKNTKEDQPKEPPATCKSMESIAVLRLVAVLVFIDDKPQIVVFQNRLFE